LFYSLYKDTIVIDNKKSSLKQWILAYEKKVENQIWQSGNIFVFADNNTFSNWKDIKLKGEKHSGEENPLGYLYINYLRSEELPL